MKCINIHDKEYAASIFRSIWDMKFMTIHDKEYAAKLRQVCSKTNLPVKMMTVCSRSFSLLCAVTRICASVLYEKAINSAP